MLGAHTDCNCYIKQDKANSSLSHPPPIDKTLSLHDRKREGGRKWASKKAATTATSVVRLPMLILLRSLLPFPLPHHPPSIRRSFFFNRTTSVRECGRRRKFDGSLRPPSAPGVSSPPPWSLLLTCWPPTLPTPTRPHSPPCLTSPSKTKGNLPCLFSLCTLIAI